MHNKMNHQIIKQEWKSGNIKLWIRDRWTTLRIFLNEFIVIWET